MAVKFMENGGSLSKIYAILSAVSSAKMSYIL